MYLRTKRTTSFSVTVQLGDNDWSNINLVFESLRLRWKKNIKNFILINNKKDEKNTSPQKKHLNFSEIEIDETLYNIEM